MKIEMVAREARDTRTGKIIALVSNKGGVGTTTAATNIAANLARRSSSVCLVDLVLGSGSVTGFLNVQPTYSIIDLAQSLRRDDQPPIEQTLVQHVSGVRVLAGDVNGAAQSRVKPADIDEIFDSLVCSFDFVVVDTPKEFDDVQLLVLDRAEIILFVTQIDVPSLRSARGTFDFFQRMGVDISKLRVLLNRYITMETMSLQAIEKILGLRVFWTIPDNYPAVVAAVNQGLPIEAFDDDSNIARSYARLPEALIQSISPAV